MAAYTYRCTECSDFEAAYPMGRAPETSECPRCRHASRRIYRAPRLGMGNTSQMQLIDRTSASADRPDVVTSIPSSGQRSPVQWTTNPLHAKLPRP